MRNSLFIWIPKTAGTSLFEVLKEHHGYRLFLDNYKDFDNTGNVSFGHLSVQDLLHTGVISRKYWANTDSFCVVRNPYDRFRSLWIDFKRSKRITEDTTLWQFAWGVRNLTNRPGLFNAKDFSQCAPQCSWVVPGTKILRFENLEADLAGIGVTQAMPHKNKGTDRFWKDDYDEDTMRLVSEIYMEDFITFDYDI